MQISFRDMVTVLHGMGFGALFMLAFSGAIGIISATQAGDDGSPAKPNLMFRFYLLAMAALAWLTVLSGAYVIYPWYRAAAPPGTTDLAAYPRLLLLSNPLTAGWHSYGMEWKEHVAWFTPIAMTMVAFVFLKYGPQLAHQRAMRTAVLGFTIAAFFSTAVAGAAGAFLGKYAPVRGGPNIVLFQAD